MLLPRTCGLFYYFSLITPTSQSHQILAVPIINVSKLDTRDSRLNIAIQSSKLVLPFVGWLIRGEEAIPGSLARSFFTLLHFGYFWLLQDVSSRVWVNTVFRYSERVVVRLPSGESSLVPWTSIGRAEASTVCLASSIRFVEFLFAQSVVWPSILKADESFQVADMWTLGRRTGLG